MKNEEKKRIVAILDDKLKNEFGVFLTGVEKVELGSLIIKYKCNPLKFTLNRQVIYVLINRSGLRGMTAYEILESLKSSKENAKPASVYRVLDYLTNIGLITKIQSRSKFIVRRFQAEQLMSIFTVCSECGEIDEKTDNFCQLSIAHFIAGLGHQLNDNTVELSVICKKCLVLK